VKRHHITIEVLKIAKHPRKDYTFNEVLAEMTAYFLMKSFDENIEYNFAYHSNVWSSRIEDNFEVDEFMTLTTKILEVSSIKTIKNHFFKKKFTKVNSQKAILKSLL